MTYICRDLFPPSLFYVIEDVELDDRIDTAVKVVKEYLNNDEVR